MTEATSRAVREGISFGLVAGLVFAFAEIIATAWTAGTPLMPFRMFASVVVGQAALQTMSLTAAVTIGLLVHLILSAAFGLVYALINAQLPANARAGWAPQAGLGVLFGALLWLVNVQLIARATYPWFLEASQPVQLALHALFFGLPLSLLYAAAERRARQAGAWRRPRPQQGLGLAAGEPGRDEIRVDTGY